MDTATGTVLILRGTPDAFTPLAFLCARCGVAALCFDHEHELGNWLQHCCDGSSPIVAVAIDADDFTARNYRLSCRTTLLERRIPLIVVDSARQNNDWCRLDAIPDNTPTIYLLTANLLPQLLTRMQQGEPSRETH